MDGGMEVLSTSSNAAGVDTGSSARELSVETVYETLSSRRRRYALHYLVQVDGPVTIRDLAEQIAAWEHHVEREFVTPKQRKRVYTGLHQTHLPKMHRLGVVEYDTNRGTIALQDTVDEFDIYLDVVPRDDIPWSQFYLALGGVLTALVTVALLGIPPFAGVGGYGYALFVALAFTVVGAVHTLRDKRVLLGTTTTPAEVTPPRELADER